MRDLVELYFKERSIVNHHISSFNDFLSTMDNPNSRMQNIVDNLRVSAEDMDRAIIRLDPEKTDGKIVERHGQAVLEQLPAEMAPGDLHFMQGALAEGWRLETADREHVNLLTDAEIFGWARPQPRPRAVRRAASPEAFYSDLAPGDWVVHVDYGIGRFAGLVERTLDDLRREFLLIEFADGDQLFVPVHQADRVTRYVGAEGATPTASRLGTQEWERTKSRAHEAVAEVARDLLVLYARRMT